MGHQIFDQQSIKDVGCFIGRGRNVLGGKRAELVGYVGIGFQPRFGPVFRASLSC